jgi:hypothetical protein
MTIWISTGVLSGRPAAPIAQDLDEQFTGRVGDLRLQSEVRRAGNEYKHLHDPDPVQIAHSLYGSGEAIERGVARELLRRFQLHILADDALAQQHAVLERQLSRDVDALADCPVVDKVGVAVELGQFQTKGLEAF